MVVLLVDALGWELARATPGFAASLPHRKPIETILGFSSGALPTVFTGRLPSEHGRWLMYRRAERVATPFAGFQHLAWLPRRVRESWRMTQLLTRTVERRGVHGYFNLYEVPRAELSAFDLAEKHDIFTPGGLPADSLWDELERRRVRWRGWNWRTPEAANLAALEQAIERGNEQVLFLYTADLDALLHREGTRGGGVRDRLARYDAWIARVTAAAALRGEALWMYVCSDHGMVDVTRTVDVMKRLEGIPVRRGHDYVAFFDSTMARFWWKTPAARDAVYAALAAEPAGHWLTEEELEREGCRFVRHEYGDEIFLLEPGALLVPSFMGSKPLAAMHGYDATHPDMIAFLASNRPVPDHVRHLAHLRGFFESELDALLAVAA